MSRNRPAPRAGARRRPTAPPRTAAEQLGSNRTLKIGIIAFAMLFTCSLLASTLVLIPFDELFGLGDDDAGNIVDPNEGLIEEQMAIVEENPDDVDAILLLANILGNSGRLDEAIPYYEQAIDLAPDDTSVRLDFARSLADGNLDADAELQFQRVLEMKPDSQEANYYLAELYMRWEPPREDEARALYEKTVDLDPDDFLAEQAKNRLSSMVATPAGGASPVSTPVGDGTGG